MAAERQISRDQSLKEQDIYMSIRILVVDDDATSLAVLSASLRKWRYQVVAVKNPLEALDILRLQKGLFDLVITDLHMPLLNGFELQKQVREEFRLPVVLISADDRKSVILKNLEGGVPFYIVKPLSPNDAEHIWQYAVTDRKGKSIAIDRLPETRIGPRGSSFGFETPNEDINLSISAHVEEESYSGKSKKKGSKRVREDEDQSELHAVRNPMKAKMVWTNALHSRFLQAIKHIGWTKAVPKRILQVMNVPGLTRENIASHLQKYRMFLKKVADIGARGSSNNLSEIDLRSAFAPGLSSLWSKKVQQEYPNPFEQHHRKSEFFRSCVRGSTTKIPALNSPNPSPIHIHNHKVPNTNSSQDKATFGKAKSVSQADHMALLMEPNISKLSNFLSHRDISQGLLNTKSTVNMDSSLEYITNTCPTFNNYAISGTRDPSHDVAGISNPGSSLTSPSTNQFPLLPSESQHSYILSNSEEGENIDVLDAIMNNSDSTVDNISAQDKHFVEDDLRDIIFLEQNNNQASLQKQVEDEVLTDEHPSDTSHLGELNRPSNEDVDPNLSHSYTTNIIEDNAPLQQQSLCQIQQKFPSNSMISDLKYIHEVLVLLFVVGLGGGVLGYVVGRWLVFMGVRRLQGSNS